MKEPSLSSLANFSLASINRLYSILHTDRELPNTDRKSFHQQTVQHPTYRQRASINRLYSILHTDRELPNTDRKSFHQQTVQHPTYRQRASKYRQRASINRLYSIIHTDREKSTPWYFITLRASCGAVYCNQSCPLCLWLGVFVCLWVGRSVTAITRNCVHRSSPNWVCR